MIINRKLHDKEDFGDVVHSISEVCQTFVVKYPGLHIDEKLNFKYHISLQKQKFHAV